MMEFDNGLIKNLIMFKKEKELEEALRLGWDPNTGGGWAIRLAARYGCPSIVETLTKYGANPHLLSESGASTLQLAVYSGEQWSGERWSSLVSCCDSSQLADGAAVALVFGHCAALETILNTGRCNTHVPTTLTGKTLEELARGYKMSHLLNSSISEARSPDHRTVHSPSNRRPYRSTARGALTPRPHARPVTAPAARNLSPSVARFFQQTAGHSSHNSPRDTSPRPPHEYN